MDADTRLYFYLLRRPASPEATDADGSGIVAVSQRKRRAFLSGRVQQLEAYLVWSHDPRLRAVADGPTSGSASRLMQWWKRRRASAPTYLRSEIEAVAARFRSTVDAGRALVAEHTPIEGQGIVEQSRYGCLAERSRVDIPKDERRLVARLCLRPVQAQGVTLELPRNGGTDPAASPNPYNQVTPRTGTEGASNVGGRRG